MILKRRHSKKNYPETSGVPLKSLNTNKMYKSNFKLSLQNCQCVFSMWYVESNKSWPGGQISCKLKFNAGVMVVLSWWMTEWLQKVTMPLLDKNPPVPQPVLSNTSKDET